MILQADDEYRAFFAVPLPACRLAATAGFADFTPLMLPMMTRLGTPAGDIAFSRYS